MHSSLLATFIAAAPGAAILPAQAVHWSPAAGGNGHWYEFVAAPNGITWEAANVLTSVPGQHLATISDAAENDFCFALASNPAAWTTNAFGCGIGPWLGGWQPPGSPEPAGGWIWVDGATFGYTNWFSGEPNNSGGTEHVLHFFNCAGNAPAKWWNDITQTIATEVLGYVVEYEFMLEPVVPGAAGGPNVLFTRWGNPGGTVYFLAGLQAGAVNVPGCGGLVVNLANPTLLGSGTTDAAGGASKTLLIPGALAGRIAYFQAVDKGACRVTNLVIETL